MIQLAYQEDRTEEVITVYEFKDAEELIQELSASYAGDIETVASGGRGRNKIEYYRYPCSFDIETSTIKPGELNYVGTKDDPPVAFPYLFQWNVYGRVIMCRTYTEALQIFSWLSEYFRLGGNRRMVCFIHNAGYEEHFFRGLWDIVPEKCFALDEHHPVTIVTKDGFMFRDAYKMTNMSLETLSKDWSLKWRKNKEIMDYSVLRTPYTELDDNTLIYSALDVLSLSDAIMEYLRARSEHIWTKCPTSTSFVRKALKSRIGIGVKARTAEQRDYWRILEKQKVDADIYKMYMRAARGGNVHANRKYTGKLLMNLGHGDIISSYPTQEVCYPEFPIGSWAPLDPGCPIEVMQQFEAGGYCCLFDVVLMDPKLKKGVTVPYISISKMHILEGSGLISSDNGRYMGGLKKIMITIFGVEWDIIRRQYDFSDAIIIKGYFARKGYLPDILRKFILELYQKKTELRGIPGKEVEYALSKTYLNSVYGMSYTNYFRDQYEMAEDGIYLKPPEDMEEFLKRYQNSVSYFMSYSWGLLCSTLGRVFLQRMIDAVGDDFVYCDTDSVFYLHPEINTPKIRALEAELKEQHRKCGLPLVYKDIKGRDHELGGISEEDYVLFFKTFGSKKYVSVENCVRFSCTVAGVPKKAGSKLLKYPWNFNLGYNFEGSKTGKNCLWYNPPLPFTLKDDQGRIIETNYNVAMLPVDYLLGISNDYEETLSVEGNFHWAYKDGNKNMLNEEDI